MGLLEDGWKRYVVSFESAFFPTFQKVIRSAKENQESIDIKNNKDNMLYKFVFDWSEDKQVTGIEVYSRKPKDN